LDHRKKKGEWSGRGGIRKGKYEEEGRGRRGRERRRGE
jgi:hypothetical protein